MASAAKRSRGKCDASFWTKGKTLELIAEFESYSDLWDIKSPLYCNRTHKQKLQAEIGAKMDIDAILISAKLHNLRCQYNGELRKLKQKKSGSGTDELYVPRWEFFNALKFLSNAGQSCSTTSNLEVLQEEENSSEDVNVCGSESNFEVVSPSSPASSVAGVSLSGSYRKKKGELKANLQKDTLLSNAMKILGAPADSQQIFGDYIADQMRNMTETKQKRLKLMIQKAIVVVEEEPEPTPSSVPEPLPPILTISGPFSAIGNIDPTSFVTSVLT